MITGKAYTTKQMGDACEMLVAAELTLAGVPALKVPDNWPSYDVIAQPKGKPLQGISVKSRTYKRGSAFVRYDASDKFDWLAIVIITAKAELTKRSIFIVPRRIADKRMTLYRQKKSTHFSCRIDRTEELFWDYRNNFGLTVKRNANNAIEEN